MTEKPPERKKVPPRAVPPRDDKYMGLAFWIASFSKDPNTQMGAIIISEDNKPLGMGFNGVSRKIRDVDVDWTRDSSVLNKYDLLSHAEENSIEHCRLAKLDYCTLYVTGKPCKRCMLRIANSGIKRVVYYPYKTTDSSSMFSNTAEFEKVDQIAKLFHVQMDEYKGNLNWMRDRMKFLELSGIFN